MKYRIVDAPSEIRLQIFGNDFQDLFVHALLGFNAVLIGEELQAHAKPTKFYDISLTAPTSEILLVDFLSEVLYRSHIDPGFLFNVQFQSLSKQFLNATLRGHQTDKKPELDIKAVTHHDVRIEEKNGKFETTVTLDI